MRSGMRRNMAYRAGHLVGILDMMMRNLKAVQAQEAQQCREQK